MKIKTPPVPERQYRWSEEYGCYVDSNTGHEQLIARDAQWLELVGPVVEALKPFAVYGRHGSRDVEVGAAIAALSAITEGEQA